MRKQGRLNEKKVQHGLKTRGKQATTHPTRGKGWTDLAEREMGKKIAEEKATKRKKVRNMSDKIHAPETRGRGKELH